MGRASDATQPDASRERGQWPVLLVTLSIHHAQYGLYGGGRVGRRGLTSEFLSVGDQTVEDSGWREGGSCHLPAAGRPIRQDGPVSIAIASSTASGVVGLTMIAARTSASESRARTWRTSAGHPCWLAMPRAR